MPSVGLSFGLIAGLISLLSIVPISVLTIGLSDSSIENKQIPNQSIHRSLWNGLSVGLISGLSVGLVGGLTSGLGVGLIGGLLGGLVTGLNFGIDSAIQHFALRICLEKNGYIPWDYATFLEHATRHRFIQGTNGRYRFIHNLLRQHLADEMTTLEQA